MISGASPSHQYEAVGSEEIVSEPSPDYTEAYDEDGREESVGGMEVGTKGALQQPHEDFAENGLPSFPSSLSSSAPPLSSASRSSITSPTPTSTLVARPEVLHLTCKERIKFALGLWPVTGALFMVYWAEYALQSGVFAAIGFPVEDEDARKQFYVYANWSYQVGVFISRSSGTLWNPGRRAMWTMSFLQTALLVLMFSDALSEWWYNNGILSLCFVVGLFGGSVYVHSFRLLAKGHKAVRELSMPIGAFACDVGIFVGKETADTDTLSHSHIL